MELVHQVLTPNDSEKIRTIEEQQLVSVIADPTERMLYSWNAKWRPESLAHYLRLGWSFGCREQGKDELLGYFLGQPLLYFRGFTQSLWIEHLSYRNAEVRDSLIEVAVKMGRDKHLQRVLFADAHLLKEALAPWKPRPFDDVIAEVATTKT